MREAPPPPPPPSDEGRPPFLGSWPRVYALVLGTLALLVALFSLVSAIYR